MLTLTFFLFILIIGYTIIANLTDAYDYNEHFYMTFYEKLDNKNAVNWKRLK